MAQWRLRDPGSFAPDFHRAMQEGEGVDKVVTVRWTKSQVERDRIEWRLFRYSLRHYSAHPSALWEPVLIHRTRIAYNHLRERWELLLTSRRKVMEEMRILP